MVFRERYSKEMIDSQMAKVKFGQKKSRELKSVTGAPFVITCHPKLREIASIMKKYQTFCIKMKLLNESLLLFQWFHIVMLES